MADDKRPSDNSKTGPEKNGRKLILLAQGGPDMTPKKFGELVAAALRKLDQSSD